MVCSCSVLENVVRKRNQCECSLVYVYIQLLYAEHSPVNKNTIIIVVEKFISHTNGSIFAWKWKIEKKYFGNVDIRVYYMHTYTHGRTTQYAS